MEVAKKTLLLAVLLTLVLLDGVWAHAVDDAVWEVKIEDSVVSSALRLPKGVLDEFDLNGDGRIVESELKPEIVPLLQNKLWVEADGQRGELKLVGAGPAAPQVTHHNIGLAWSFPKKPEKLTFHYNHWFASSSPGEELLCLASFESEAGTTNHVFTEAESTFEISQARGSIGKFFKVGLQHIVEGYDHLLFVGVLLLAGASVAGLVKMITAFTVAHSLTLALAVLGMFTLPASIVEPLIAVSVVVCAVENIRSDKAENRWILAGLLGLVHGMGFAGVLADMNLSGSSASGPLLGFNLGVEAGQLAIVLCVMPIYWFVGKQDWNRKFRIGGSVIAALIALFWTIQRVLGG